MAITATKISEVLHFGPGDNGIEYSITFDTNYPATGGEALPLGSNTNFKTTIRRMIVTKQFRDTNLLCKVDLVPSTVASSAGLKLYKIRASTTNTSFAVLVEFSTTTDASNVSGRAILMGY
jgi:hypothetical protein